MRRSSLRVLGAVVAAVSACSDARPLDQARPGPATTLDTSTAITTTSSGVAADRATPWGPIPGGDVELLAFAGSSRESVVVATSSGQVVGEVHFDAQVDVAASPHAGEVVVADTGGPRVWIIDATTGTVVDELEREDGPDGFPSVDARFVAEVHHGNGTVDDEGSVTIRDAKTSAQLLYVSTEPGWIHDDAGVAFARSSDLVALPTTSTSRAEHALLIMDAATGLPVATGGPGPDDFLGWAGGSCWLTVAGELLRADCVEDGSISSVATVDTEALWDIEPGRAEVEHISIDGDGRVAMSLPPSTADGTRSLVVVVGSPASATEIGSGSFPRWSPTGRSLAVATARGPRVLDPDGLVLATYDGAPEPPVWIAGLAAITN